MRKALKNKTALSLFLKAVLAIPIFWGISHASAQTSGSPSKGTITALINARILGAPSFSEPLVGTILVADGKISAVGDKVEVPAGSEVIDCQGLTVTPGFIDLQSRLWMDAASANQAGGDGSLDAFDALDEYSEDWREVVRAGVTTVYLQPSSSDICSGVGVVATTYKSPGKSIVIKRDAGLQMALGVGADLSGRGRARQFDRLKKLLEDARKYQSDWKAYHDYQEQQRVKTKPEGIEGQPAPNTEKKATENKADEAPSAQPENPSRGSGRGRGGFPRRGESGGPENPNRDPSANPNGPGSATGENSAKPQENTRAEAEPKKTDEPKTDEPKPPVKPKLDPVKERLVKALTGELPVCFRVAHPDDCTRALDLAKQFGLSVIFNGLDDDTIPAANLFEAHYSIALVAGPSPSKSLEKLWDARLRDYAGRLILVSGGNDGRSSRTLRAQAAVAVALGMPMSRALEALTINPASALGLDDQLGTIAVGKRADLAIFAGDPLDVVAPVQMTMIDGQIVWRHAAQSVSSSNHELAEPVAMPEAFPKEYQVASSRVLNSTGAFETRTLTIRHGKITANEAGRPERTKLPIFDLGNLVISPGLFSAQIAGANQGAAESDARHLHAVDTFDPTANDFRATIESGVLTSLLVPSAQNSLAGRCGLIQAGSESILQRDLGDLIVLTSTARNRDRFPSTLLGQRDLVRDFLSQEPVPTRIFLPEIAQQSIQSARQLGTRELLEGKRLAIFQASSDAEVSAALDLIEQFHLKAAIGGIEHVGQFIERLVNSRTALVVRPFGSGEYQQQLDDWVAASQAGIPILFSGSDAGQIRSTTAMLVEAGMNEATALQSICSGSERLGINLPGIEVGSPANFVIWNGVPCDLRSRILRVVVDGQHLNTQHNSAGSRR